MILLTFLFKSLFLQSGVQSCTIHNETGICCFNFYKNKSGQCIQCPLGTFGTNCTGRCPSGFFGILCRERCSCEEDICDRAVGCPSQTNWSDISTSTFTSVGKILSTGSPTKAMSSSSWKNTLFTALGSIGTLFVVGVLYIVKSWYIKMRTGTVGNPTRTTENTLDNNITLWNTDNESDEDNNHTNSYTGLLVENGALHEEKLENDYNPYVNLGYYKENEENCIENKTENLENEYEDAWSDKNVVENATFNNISKSSKLTLPRRRQCVEIKRRPYSSVKYNRNNERGASSESNSAYNYIGDISKTRDEDQRNIDNTQNDIPLAFGGIQSGKKDATSELIEYEDLNIPSSAHPEHYTDLTFPNENSYSEINKNREKQEEEFSSTEHLHEADDNVESTEMYTVPNFPGRESICNEDFCATNSNSLSYHKDKETITSHLINEGDQITEENLSIYEDVTVI